MSDATNTVGEAASDCLWTPLILISGSNSDSICSHSELTHILLRYMGSCDPGFKARQTQLMFKKRLYVLVSIYLDIYVYMKYPAD